MKRVDGNRQVLHFRISLESAYHGVLEHQGTLREYPLVVGPRSRRSALQEAHALGPAGRDARRRSLAGETPPANHGPTHLPAPSGGLGFRDDLRLRPCRGSGTGSGAWSSRGQKTWWPARSSSGTWRRSWLTTNPVLAAPPAPACSSCWNPKAPSGRTPIFILIGLSARPCMDFGIYYIYLVVEYLALRCA